MRFRRQLADEKRPTRAAHAGSWTKVQRPRRRRGSGFGGDAVARGGGEDLGRAGIEPAQRGAGPGAALPGMAGRKSGGSDLAGSAHRMRSFLLGPPYAAAPPSVKSRREGLPRRVAQAIRRDLRRMEGRKWPKTCLCNAAKG